MRCGGEGLSAWQVLVKVMFDFIMAIQHQHARCNTQDATPKMQHPRCNTQARHMQIPAGVRFIMAMHNSDDSLGGFASSCRGTRTPWPLEPMAYSEYPFSTSTPCTARAATSARAIGRLAFRTDALHERCTARPGADAMPWCIASASRHTSCCSGDADGALLQRHLHSEGNPTGQAHPPQQASKQTNKRAGSHARAGEQPIR